MATTRLSRRKLVAVMRPSPDQIRDWLDAVPDPEIPVISVVDLGIVRAIHWEDDTLNIAITPTLTAYRDNFEYKGGLKSCSRLSPSLNRYSEVNLDDI